MRPELICRAFSDHFRLREDVSLLFDYRNGIFHRLENESAREIASMAITGRHLPEIVESLVRRYGIDRSRAYADVAGFFESMDPDAPMQVADDFYGLDKGYTGLGFPLRMEIELTALCNWNCGFCYNVWKIDPSLSERETQLLVKRMSQKHLPTATALSVIDECHEKGCMVLRYSGGETMLHPDLMRILEHGGRRKMFQVLFTNGHFLTAETGDRLAAANVRVVLISLHGTGSLHDALTGRKGARSLAMRAIDVCLERGIEVVVELTLVRENLQDVLSVAQAVYDRGVREFRVMRYVGRGKEDECYAVDPSEVVPLMLQLRDLEATTCPGLRVGWPCGQRFCLSERDAPIEIQSDPLWAARVTQLTGHCESGINWGSISFDGRLRNCPHSNVYHGSVTESGLESTWLEMVPRVEDVLRPRSSCAGCEALGLCRGGCHLGHFLERRSEEPSLGSV